MIKRRQFLVLAAAVAVPLRAKAQRTTVDLATYSHIDVAWRWPLQEGLQQSDSTFRSVLRVLDAFPSLKFSGTSASYYAWIRRTDPTVFAEIAEKVRAGQWEPIGGWWTEADVNIVSGESLMRQAFYGQREFQNHLGVKTSVAFLPDSFGSSANLPAILRASGFRYYVMGRGTFDGTRPPRGAFLWHSLGDASIVTYDNPVSGGTNDAVKTVTEAAALQNDLLVWFGLGDHGGGPTIESLQALEAFLATPDAPAVNFTTMAAYLSAVPRPQTQRRGEIEGVFPGAYTNCYDLKRSMIDAERALIDCERFDVLAALCGIDDEPPALDDLWQTLLLNQHHDTISATGLKQNVALAIAQNRAIAERARTAAMPYLEQIVNRIAHSPQDEAVLVVFNPLPHPLKTAAIYPLRTPNGNVPLIYDADGTVVPAQFTAGDGVFPGEGPPTIFAVELPAFGYATYRVNGSRPAGTGTIQPAAFTVRLDSASGLPSQLTDSKGSVDLANARFSVFSDRGDTWASDGLSAYPQFGYFDFHGTTELERGPVRRVHRATYTFRQSRLEALVEVRNDERAVRFTVDSHWNEPFMRMGFSFDYAGDSGIFDVPFGAVTRAASTAIQPGISFVARERRGGGLLALVSCGSHGFWASQTTLGVTLARSTAYSALDQADYRVTDLQDTGFRRLTFMLGFYDDLAELRRAADAFEREIPVYWNGTHDGSLPLTQGFAELPEGLTVSSLRREGASTEARLHNLVNAGVSGTGRIGSAEFNATIDPFGIRTYRTRGQRFEDVSPG